MAAILSFNMFNIHSYNLKKKVALKKDWLSQDNLLQLISLNYQTQFHTIVGFDPVCTFIVFVRLTII